ncbi:MAG TPA: lytic transglycosylase domain-containing protein [Burkholderiaceae bacterium]|nr:lytic transglycosylase domain-containing protein [Burkholderiaceae bacterium]
MTTKTIHKIEVDSSQFKAFYDLFKQYSAALDDMPEEWKRVNGEVSDAGKSMEDFATASGVSKESLAMAAAQAKIISDAVAGVAKGTHAGTKAQKDFLVSLHGSGKAMREMAKDAKKLGSEVFGIGRYLLKIGVLGSGVAGLGGILSGLGLADLARSAVAGQRDARGIGVSVGQLQAFRTDFGRYADPGVLNRMADAQGDMAKWGYLSLATGTPLGQIPGANPVALSLAMMRRAHDWWDKTPVSQRTANNLQITGLNQFMSFEEVRRLGAMTNGEFAQARNRFASDARNLNLSGREVDAWNTFIVEVKNAGMALDTDLKRKLAELGPSMGGLIETLSTDGRQLIDEVLTPANINNLKRDIDGFTNLLGSPEFHNDIREFIQFVGDAAHGLKVLAEWLDPSLKSSGNQLSVPGTGAAINGLDPGSSTGHSIWHDLASPGDMVNDGLSQLGRKAKALEGKSRDKAYDDASLWGKLNMDFGGRKSTPTPAQVPKKELYLYNLEKKYGLPHGILDSTWFVESSRGVNAGPSGSGALGDFQFLKATGRQYGLINDTDRTDFHKSAAAAASYYADLKRKFHGDMKKAIAAYFDGPANVAGNYAKQGGKMPPQTQHYVDKTLSTWRANRETIIKVVVTNSTGSNVAVSTNAGALS